MSFIKNFEKTADPIGDMISLDRADVTVSDLSDKVALNSTKTNKLPRGNNPRERVTSQSSSGNVTHSFSSEKEIDQERHPFKSWYNSRYKG